MPDSTSTEKLFQQIAYLDKKVFEAYNSCNLSLFKDYFVEDLEFYHDKSGLVLSRKKMVEALEAALCGNPNIKTRRELIPDSLEVYPLMNFGAIEIGSHYYYQSIDGLPEVLVEVAKFTHIWHKMDDTWKICRVMSYDHRSLKNEKPSS